MVSLHVEGIVDELCGLILVVLCIDQLWSHCIDQLWSLLALCPLCLGLLDVARRTYTETVDDVSGMLNVCVFTRSGV